MFPERTEFPPRLCRGWEAAGCSSACCASGHCRSRWHWHRRALSLFLRSIFPRPALALLTPPCGM